MRTTIYEVGKGDRRTLFDSPLSAVREAYMRSDVDYIRVITLGEDGCEEAITRVYKQDVEIETFGLLRKAAATQ